MQLIGVEPRDFFCLFEISLSDLKKVELFLQKAVFNYDGTNPEEKEAEKYIKKFAIAVHESIKGVEDGVGSNK